ncbi:MAG: hypothetical protein MI976_05925 [Pseudomonadales bacterium]|nr:hypothetical protein [Pseudomonadales bacterium]
MLLVLSNAAKAVLGTEAPLDNYTPSSGVPELPGHNYLLRYRYTSFEPDEQSLLFASFKNRATAAEIIDATGTYRAQLFTHQKYASKTYGAVRTLQDPSKPSEESYGGTLQFDMGESIAFSAGYMGGQLSWAEEDYLFDAPQAKKVDTWNLGTTTHFLEKRLSMRIEYAESTYRTMHLNAHDIHTPGQAMLAEMSISTELPFFAGWFNKWAGTAVYQSVGKNYTSLGNSGLCKGRDSAHVKLRSKHKKLGMELEWQQLGSNEENQLADFQPTEDRAGVRLLYDLDPALFRVIPFPMGKPSLSAHYMQVKQWENEAAILAQGYELQRAGDQVGVNLHFDYSIWRWGINYQAGYEDHERQYLVSEDALLEQPSDWQHEIAELVLGWVPNDAFKMNVSARWKVEEQPALDNRYQTRNIGLKAFVDELLDDLSFSMEYYYDMDANNLGESKKLDKSAWKHSGKAQITWHTGSFSHQFPPMDIYFRSSFKHQTDRPSAVDEEQWSASLGVELPLNR